MHRHEDQFRRGDNLPELNCRIDAIQKRHRNIEKNGIRFQFLGGGQERLPILYAADQFELIVPLKFCK